jgi:hypothetical protein
MYHPYHQQVFEQPTALLENQSLSSNSSSTLSQNHLLTDQTSLDTIVDTMTEDSKRKRSLERNRLAGKQSTLHDGSTVFTYSSLALSRKKEKRATTNG